MTTTTEPTTQTLNYAPSIYVPPGTYEQQRYERLLDSVSEYLDDSDGEPEVFLADVIRALAEGRKYFSERVAAYDVCTERLGQGG